MRKSVLQMLAKGIFELLFGKSRSVFYYNIPVLVVAVTGILFKKRLKANSHKFNLRFEISDLDYFPMYISRDEEDIKCTWCLYIYP